MGEQKLAHGRFVIHDSVAEHRHILPTQIWICFVVKNQSTTRFVSARDRSPQRTSKIVNGATLKQKATSVCTTIPACKHESSVAFVVHSIDVRFLGNEQRNHIVTSHCRGKNEAGRARVNALVDVRLGSPC